MGDTRSVGTVVGHIQHVQLEANPADGKYLLCRLIVEAHEKTSAETRFFFLKMDQADPTWFGLVLGLIRGAFVREVFVRITYDESATPLGKVLQICGVRLQVPGL